MAHYTPTFSELHEHLVISPVLARTYTAVGHRAGVIVSLYRSLSGTLLAFKGRAAGAQQLGLTRDLSDEAAEQWLMQLLPAGGSFVPASARRTKGLALWMFRKFAPEQLEESFQLAKAADCLAVYERMQAYLGRHALASELSRQAREVLREVRAGSARLSPAHRSAAAAVLGELALSRQDGLADLRQGWERGANGGAFALELPNDTALRWESRLNLACKAVENAPRHYPFAIFLSDLFPAEMVQSLAIALDGPPSKISSLASSPL